MKGNHVMCITGALRHMHYYISKDTWLCVGFITLVGTPIYKDGAFLIAAADKFGNEYDLEIVETLDEATELRDTIVRAYKDGADLYDINTRRAFKEIKN